MSTKKCYKFEDLTKEYLYEDLAFESPLEPGVFPLPANATFIEPPQVQEYQVAVFTGSKWEVKKDYRKKPFYDVTQYWWAEPQYMTEIGDVPERMSFIKFDVPEDVVKCRALINEVNEAKSYLDSTDKKEMELQMYLMGFRQYLTEEDVEELKAIQLERDNKASSIRPKNEEIKALKNQIALMYGQESVNHI